MPGPEVHRECPYVFHRVGGRNLSLPQAFRLLQTPREALTKCPTDIRQLETGGPGMPGPYNPDKKPPPA